MLRSRLRRHAIDQVVAVAMDPHTDPATRAALMHHVLDTASDSSAARGTGPSNIVQPEQGRAYVGTKETGGVASGPMRTLLANRRLQWIIGAFSALVLAGAIVWLIRQSHYRGMQPTTWFAEDTVLIGLIAVVAALFTAAFAYPTFLDWRDQIRGPHLKMQVQYRKGDGKTFAELRKEDVLSQINSKKDFPFLRIKIDNDSRVALRDGRLSIYVQPPDGGDHAPDVEPVPPEGKQKNAFEPISHVYSSEEPDLPATLLEAECLCPPKRTSYLQDRFDFRTTDVDLYLRIVLTGSNLPGALSERYKVRVSTAPLDGNALAGAAAPTAAETGSDLTTRLQKIKELRDADVLTQDEYKTKRAEIIDSI